jgi:uncharacterized membrane protein YraQ (UPF0718 family)
VPADRPVQRTPWRELLREAFGKPLWPFALFAVATAAVCYHVLGPEAFALALAEDMDMALELLPRLAAAQVIAAILWVLLPRDRISQLLGTGGRRGLLIATAAGIVTPGGPASAFPLLALLASAGADRGVMVAYITSWALLGLQRIVVWDIPFMGADFSVLRFALSLPLPVLAGMLARRLPVGLSLDAVPPARRGPPE